MNYKKEEPSEKRSVAGRIQDLGAWIKGFERKCTIPSFGCYPMSIAI
jgi:hypothetical protein